MTQKGGSRGGDTHKDEFCGLNHFIMIQDNRFKNTPILKLLAKSY